MDEEYFIKLEEESPIKTTPNPHHFLTNFYDTDSPIDNIIKKEAFEVDELVDTLANTIDISNMPINEIIFYAQANYDIDQNVCWNNFHQKIKKRKIIMKRSNAKARTAVKMEQQKCEVKKEYFVVSDHANSTNIKDEIQEEIKKKRNRISAQNSRDRRKVKIQELEIDNKKLKAETEKIMEENQKLKREVEEFNRIEDRKSKEAGNGGSKFLSFIIMLGMFFMMTIFGDNSKSMTNNFVIKEEKSIFSAEEQLRIISDGQKAFQNLQSDQQLLDNFDYVKGMMFRLEELRLRVIDIEVPKHLKEEIEVIRRQVS